MLKGTAPVPSQVFSYQQLLEEKGLPSGASQVMAHSFSTSTYGDCNLQSCCRKGLVKKEHSTALIDLCNLNQYPYYF